MTFVVFGAVVLGEALGELDWRIVLYAVLSLTLVRMLPVALSLLGTGARRPTIGYTGWFGPRGLASIVFAVLILEGSELESMTVVIATIAVTVALSVFAHGISAVPLTRAYARWYEANPLPPRMESLPASEVPWRRRSPG